MRKPDRLRGHTAQVIDHPGIGGVAALEGVVGAGAKLDHGVLIREVDNTPSGAEQLPAFKLFDGHVYGFNMSYLAK